MTGLDAETFGNPCLWLQLKRNFGWRQSARKDGVLGGGNTANGLNLPGGSLYGFGRLHIPLDDVWIFSAGGWSDLPPVGNGKQASSLITEPTSPAVFCFVFCFFVFLLGDAHICVQGRLHQCNKKKNNNKKNGELCVWPGLRKRKWATRTNWQRWD